MKHSDLIVGNSSSGLIEAPVIGTRVINIGDRQKGRIRPKEIYDIKCNKQIIEKAIKKNIK